MHGAPEEIGLGELLVLIVGAHRSFRTVRGEVRMWHHSERQHEAITREHEGRGVRRSSQISMMSGGGDSDAAPPPVEREEHVRIWVARPDHMREEVTHAYGDPPMESTFVQVGEVWWSHSSVSGAYTNDGDPDSMHGTHVGISMFNPGELLSFRDLEIAGRTTQAGRAAIRVLSRPSPRDSFFYPQPHEFFRGLPQELLIDAERGVILRSVSFLDDEPFASTEFISVAFDEELPEETFVFVPPPGEEIRSLRDAQGMKFMQLHEAARDAPFGVYVPSSVPEGWRMNVLFIAERGRRGAATVGIHYADEMARMNVNISEQAADDEGMPQRAPDGDDWRIEHLPSGELRLWEPSDPERGMPRIGLLELGGTRIQISSGELGLEAIAQLARDLVAAPTEPPVSS